MLRIEIVNDGSADTPENMAHPPGGKPFPIIGNYNYRIFINAKLVDSGRIENHNTLTGWQGLLSCLDEVVNGDRFRD